MKKILPFLLIAVLAVVVVVQYLRLQRLSPAEDYTYALREDIDLDYHQPEVVGAYYAAGQAVGSFARTQWYDQGINVRLTDPDRPEEVAAGQHYNRLVAYADSLGARLHRSQRLKDQGLSNADIRRMEFEGLSPAHLRVERTFGATRLVQGDKNAAVWALQDLLIRRGYEIPHDGNFWIETRTAVVAFQSKYKLPATGIADFTTLSTLIDQTQNP